MKHVVWFMTQTGEWIELCTCPTLQRAELVLMVLDAKYHLEAGHVYTVTPADKPPSGAVKEVCGRCYGRGYLPVEGTFAGLVAADQDEPGSRRPCEECST